MLPKVLAGPARVYVANYGAALPARSSIADLKAGTFPGFEFLGETTEAVTITDTPTFVEARTQQRTRTVQRFLADADTTVETTLGDISADRFADLCLGTITDGPTETSVEAAGSPGAAPVKSIAVLFPVKDDSGALHTGLFVAERCVVTSGLTYNIDKENQAVLPFTFAVDEPGTTDAAYELLLPGTPQS